MLDTFKGMHCAAAAVVRRRPFDGIGATNHRACLLGADAGNAGSAGKIHAGHRERLKKPEDGNWLLFRRTYDGWGYSPLAQITPANVGRLQPVWSFATGQIEGHQAPPIVNNGVMFVATPGNQVLALEAKTGALLWRYKRPLPEDLTNRCIRPAAASVCYGDKVYFASADANLVAIDAKTGKEMWIAKVADYKNGYYMSLMPLVADGKVMLGTSGGELACAALSPPMTPRAARSYGGPTRFRRQDSRAARPGRRATSGRPAAARSGSPAPTTPRPISPSGAPAMAARGWATSAPATISTPRQSSRSTARPGRSRGTSSTIRTIPGIGMKSRRRSSSTTSTTAGRSKALSMSPATVISGSLSAPPTRSSSSPASRL